ncbi:mkl [Symbiodinium necroappetens]|uniref:Mkl protein n=1 Tax=Symbiodinium necroappetens TaxID=1628268 RepID=A0A813C6Y1_9DINO|nr:mkl [Symbiodinium necroappetens]
MPKEPVIKVRGVKKIFGEQVVLDGINLDVYEGETMVVMGGSGSGKSTLLRIMIGSIRPEEGSVELFGKNIVDLDESELNEVRKKFGILFQSGALFNSMTIAENVALPLQEHTDLAPEIIDIQVKIKLELVGLREHADKYPAQISGGMNAEIDQLMVDLSKKLHVTSIVVTHEMDSAFTIADRMAMLDKGKMLVVESREYFEQMRDTPLEQAKQMSQTDQLIRQFLRGDPEGPITKRKEDSSYEEDLLGTGAETLREKTPSIVTTRAKAIQ